MDHTFWYLSRAAGLVAYLLLFASVTLGLVITTDLPGRHVKRNRLFDLHQFVSLLTLAIVALHVLFILPDGYFGFSPRQLLVPFASPYRPVYTALGVFALYLTLLVTLSFWIRPLISYRGWRILHYATFGSYALALVHGIGAGTDAGAGWAVYMYVVSGATTAGLIAYRVLKPPARAPRASVGQTAAAPSARLAGNP